MEPASERRFGLFHDKGQTAAKVRQVVLRGNWPTSLPVDSQPDLLALMAPATTALAARRNPSAHKRLILLATTMIVGAAYDRWWGDALTQAFGDGLGGMLINEFAITDLIIFAALAYDYATRGRIHKGARNRLLLADRSLAPAAL